jgi:hypothetical protein
MKNRTTDKNVEPAIRCSSSATLPLGDLKPNPRNPNKHSDRQLEVYVKILKHQGWRRAVVVSKQSGLVVTGHGAIEAARRAGWSTVPVEYQDFKNPADELAHMLADNQLSRLSELDLATVRAIEADLSGAGLDLSVAGLDVNQPIDGKVVSRTAFPPPTRTWFLIGFPTVKMTDLQPIIDQLSALPEVYVKSTINSEAGE